MPTPTIPAGNLFMNATLYTGNSSTQTITNGVAGQSFQPDFVWTKDRSVANNHLLGDSVRGTNNTLFSNNAFAVFTDRGVDSFNSNGFTYSGTEGGDGNVSGNTYVAWQWKAGGTAVSNTSGTISAQVSANTTSGFSIVTYTGTGSAGTVGHGLGAAPQMIISKNRSATENWRVGSIGLTNMASWHCNLDTTQAQSNSGAAIWNNTTPTSTIFGVGTDTSVSGSGNLIVAYCWTPIAGYSAFGNYTGNGSTDGPFVYTGFRPRFLLTKRSDAVESWRIGDSARSPYNAVVLELFANLSNVEENNSNPIDYLSNGFKIRTSSSSHNASGGTYIYMVFAENPFKYANAR